MSLADLPSFRTVRQQYDHLVERDHLARDEKQIAVVGALDRLIEEISRKRLAKKSSALGWLFAKRRPPEPVKGLYIHGSVGRGKSMLMDMFFERLPVKRKRRVHFNDFMADVHDRIQRHREAVSQGKTRHNDPIPPVAGALAQEAWVLCLDEFSVTDIADAMVLSRLFSALFERGIILVATSNVAPRELYRDGLNRGLFEPFIAILEQNAHVLTLDGEIDYRHELLDRMPVYMTPADAKAQRSMNDAWATITAGHETGPDVIEVKGRKIAVPQANRHSARFAFADLCEKPLGARDYLAIAKRFDTLFIDDIPVLGPEKRNEAKRFILLIDTLYDNKMRLVASAEAPPAALYQGRTGTEAFEFERTASRLTEMQSREWLEAVRNRVGGRA